MTIPTSVVIGIDFVTVSPVKSRAISAPAAEAMLGRQWWC